MFYAPKHAKVAQASPARRRVAGVALAGAAATAGTMATASTATAAPSATTKAAAPSAASTATANVWDRVAKCESGGNWSINTGNGFYGGLQFHPQTWRGFGGTRYASSAHQATRAEQITIAKKVLKAQGPGAWPVCSRKAGLTKANGLAASTGGTSTASRSASRPSMDEGRLAVDGQLGTRTKAAIEEWSGAPINGRLGTKWDVHRFQKKAGVPSGERNGWLYSKGFVKRLEAKWNLPQDGKWDAQLTKDMQQYLNWKLGR